MIWLPKIRREVTHGGVIPRGWRFAWYEPRRRVAVYLPPPLHWLLRAVREFSHRVCLAWDAPPIERSQVFEMQRIHRERQRLADEYSRGYLVGWHECFRACIEVVEDKLTRPADLLDITAFVIDPAKLPEGN
ncbi:MAG TPA: hypothetical protein VEJ38_00925 [Candidatus Acidoferrales bacterium]|nr:hypothetical protein [Candidatus Acidoferrales bacterium]